MAVELIRVEVAYAASATQSSIKCVDSDPGSTVEQVIRQSGILSKYPEIDLQQHKVGIFGQLVTLQQPVNPGDRVEIYRPLLKNPMDARREKARS